MRALLDVTKAINNNVGRDQLLELYGRIMHDELGITRLILFENTGVWNVSRYSGLMRNAIFLMWWR